MGQVQWDLNHASHIIFAANELGGTKNWASPTNAQGPPDGVLAAFDGDALLLAAADLHCEPTEFPDKPTSLEIQSVHLDFYGSVAGLPAVSDLVSRLNLRFHFGGASVARTLESITTGDADFLAVSKSFRIDNGAGQFIDTPPTSVSWANLGNLVASWDALTAVGLVGAHYRADAVRLRVVASETQTV